MIALAVVTVLVCLMGHALTVIAALRMHTSLVPVMLHAVSAAGWHVVQIAALAVVGALHYYWHSAALFGFGVMVYVFGFSAVYKSVSLRILIFLAKQGMQATKISDIHARVVMNSFRQRVDLLVASRLVLRQQGTYSLTTAGMKVLKKLSMLRTLFGIRATGLYFEESANRTKP